MELPTYFKDFLTDIRLTQNQVSDLKTGHTTLRERLKNNETVSKIIVSTFLQGSYRRSTAVRPKGDARSDIDIIVVTKLSMDEYTPEEALNTFIPFLDEHYKDKYRIQGRSIGISLSYVDMDIVVTAAPSESEISILESDEVTSDLSIEELEEDETINECMSSFQKSLFYSSRSFFSKNNNTPEWKLNPLFIPDRDTQEWEKTHPLEQIRWTCNKNSLCNGHYINVVKALKWWRKEKYPDAGHPKSYPLEHFIGFCCPHGIISVAEGVTLTLENIVNNHSQKPELPDHGVPEHDVFRRLTDENYGEFYNNVVDAAKIAREALDIDDVTDSANKWKELFGSKFPDPPKKSSNSNNTSGGFTSRSEQTNIKAGGRFA